jgi:uncharacterized protein YbjT (DUF2867 family)
MTVVINTPNGHIGRRVTQRLLDSDVPVRVITRSPNKVLDLTSRGSEIVVGSIDDAGVLDRALEGAEAMLWVTPPAARPDFATWTSATAKTVAKVVTTEGVERMVNVSSIGAQAGSGTGPIAYLSVIEGIFNADIPNVVHLRPGTFMENYLNHVPTIASEGTIYQTLPKSAAMPIIATRDIADVALSYLLSQNWEGQSVHELLGPRDVSPSDVAAIIGKAIDRPIELVEISIDQARERMLAAGLPDFVVDLYSEMLAAMKEGRIVPDKPRSPASTTPTGLAEFARDVLKPAIEKSS